MLPKLLPELIDPILTLLSVKDIKNVSLCSKLCNHLVAPTVWENVNVTSDRLLASTSVPSHISFACNLFIACQDTADEQEFTIKLVALLKLSSPTTFSFFRCSEASIVTRCLATISELTSLKNFKLFRCTITDAGVEHIGCLTSLVKVDISYSGDISDAGLEPIGYLTGLKNLNVRQCDISDAGLEHIGRLTGLV